MKKKVAIFDFQMISVLGDTCKSLFTSFEIQKEMGGKHSESTTSGKSHWVNQVDIDLKQLLGNKGWRQHNRATLMACLAGKRLIQNQLANDHWLCRPEDMGLIMGSSTDFNYAELESMIKEKALHKVNPLRVLTLSANVLASLTSIYLKIKAFALTQATGFLAGMEAIDLASQSLRAGRCQWVIAGGAEEVSLQATQTREAAFFQRSEDSDVIVSANDPKNRIPIGEGCAMLLCGFEAPKNNVEIKPRALIQGFSLYCNAEPKSKSDPTAAIQAIDRAFVDAGIQASHIGAIFLASNSYSDQDLAEAKALCKVFGEKMPPSFVLKNYIGETFHAGGTLSAAIAIACMEKGYLPPNKNLAQTQWVEKLNLHTQKKRIETPYVLIMGMEHNYKASALILSLPNRS